MSVASMRMRTPSPKTVTFDPSPPTTLERRPRRFRFKGHREWEEYLNALLADLQNTVSGGIGSPYGYGSTGSVRSTTRSPDSDGYASRTELYGPKSVSASSLNQ
nr:unnamed protein product [Callosobruchus analis]